MTWNWCSTLWLGSPVCWSSWFSSVSISGVFDQFFFLTQGNLCFPTVFKAAPPTPPSAAQEATKTPNPLQSSPFLHSIKRLMLNRNYVLLLVSYGMNVGVFYAISTLLNQVSVILQWIINNSPIAVAVCPKKVMGTVVTRGLIYRWK